MKVLKKLLAALLTVPIFASALTGCSISALSGKSDLPDDGIVKKAVFEDAQKNSRMLEFRGKSGNISYSWFFNGSSVSSPADQNLRVEITDARSELLETISATKAVKVHFNEKSLIQAQTTLQIDFPELWNANKVRIYQKNADGIHRLLEAPLNNSSVSSLIFPVNDTANDLYLVAVDDSFHESIPPHVSAPPESGSASKSTDATVGSSSSAVSSTPEKSPTSSGSQAPPPASGGKKAFASSSPGQKDRYQTDPTPAGKPKPVEPQDIKKNTDEVHYCTISIDCKTILDNQDQLNPEKKPVLPEDGIILKSQKVLFYEGESVFDVLLRETKKNGIQMEYKATPVYNSNYIEGIHNLYEFDCGELSGWMYQVNGWYPNYGCSRYLLKDGDVVNWRFTCDLGRDVGSDWDVSKK